MPARKRSGRTKVKPAVLQALASRFDVTRAAKVAGINRATVYRWLANDAAFRAAFATLFARFDCGYEERWQPLISRAHVDV